MMKLYLLQKQFLRIIIFLKKSHFLIYIPLFGCAHLWNTQPLLHGEWTMSCTQIGAYYFTNKLAFFSGNKVIHSWKWYGDSHCKTKIRGEYWDEWKMTFEGSSPVGPGVIQVKSTLIDGHKKQCPVELDILLKKEKQLYMGDKYSGTDNQLPCGERPTKLSKSFFTFSRSLSQTIKEYTKLLNRRIYTDTFRED